MKYLIFVFLFFLNISSHAQDFKLETLTSKQGVIWGFDFLSDTEIIFTEREGHLKILNIETKKITPITGLPKISQRGQGGLLDILLDPDFKTNQKIYLSYAVEAGDGHTTRVSSFELKNNKLVNPKELFQAMPPTTNGEHFGSRLQIDENGFLFISIGDRGERKLAQDLNTHMGKIIRIKTDGSIPKDNPFFGKKNSKPEIWSYGHRNPQGLFYDRETKKLWNNEHGPRGGDEINLVEKGKNYGWPVITYGKEYWGPSIGEKQKSGMEQPIYQYTPSIAPSALILYKGKHFPKWKDSFLSSALAITQVNRLYKDGNTYKEESLLKDLGKRIRNIKEDKNGYLYISTDSGEIYRLK